MENPFIVQREIAYGEPFCDREEEIGKVIESASRGEAVCLLSPRRYGKSSLLNQVLGRMQEGGWVPVRVDVMEVFSLRDLARELELKRIAALGTWDRIKQKAMETAAHLKPKVELDPISGQPGVSLELGEPGGGEEFLVRSVLKKMISLTKRLDRPVCLVLDEFQEVAALDTKNRIEGVIRGVFQKRPKGFVPIYSGSRRHMLKLMFEDESAPFYRSARILELGTLSSEKFVPFIQEQFQKTLRLKIPEVIVNATCRVFDGHPHVLNKTASYLWTRCAIEGKMSKESLKSVWREIVLDIIEEEKSYYDFANRSIPRYAMAVLREVARTGVVTAPYSSAFAKACGLTPGQIQNALRVLQKEDKIVETESGIKVMDPLESACLRVLGHDRETQAESLDRLVEKGNG
jgi:hypothetical protein